MNIIKLHMDFETFSHLDIKKVGSYKHLSHPSAEPLMVSWCINKEPVSLIDFTVEGWRRLWKRVVDLLMNPNVIIYAFNANFERLVLKILFGIDLPAWRFRCVMAKLWSLSFSGSLGDIGKQLGLPQDKIKMDRGAKLIQKFCKPAPSNHKADRYDRFNSPNEWEEFKQYCIRDTESEREIDEITSGYELILSEQKLWELDSEINDRGIPIDMNLVRNAQEIRRMEEERIMDRLKDLTGLKNPNSRDQMLAWLQNQGLEIDNLQAPTIARIIEELES